MRWRRVAQHYFQVVAAFGEYNDRHSDIGGKSRNTDWDGDGGIHNQNIVYVTIDILMRK